MSTAGREARRCRRRHGGDYGQPRAAVVVQTDLLNETHDSVLVCLVTSTLIDAPVFRLTVEPSKRTGIERRSQIMVDKMVAVPRSKRAALVDRGVLDLAAVEVVLPRHGRIGQVVPLRVAGNVEELVSAGFDGTTSRPSRPLRGGPLRVEDHLLSDE